MSIRFHLLTACSVTAMALFLTMCSCDSNPQGPTGPVDIGTLDDWIAFDESNYYSTAEWPRPEPHYNGDYIIGEPFTDVNGNGVFDEGTDVFEFPADDLNDNGKYDGPNDPWSPGVPYDDLNGNGLYDDPRHNPYYEDGDPFLDLNGNGVWDYPALYAVVHWLHYDTYITATRWCVEYCDSAALFTSDSDRKYWLPRKHEDWWDYLLERPRRDTTLVFDLSDSGLTLSSHRYNNNTLLHVLPRGDVILGSSRVMTSHGGIGDSTSFLRSVSHGEQLEIYGETFDDLLCVRFEDAWPDNDSIRVSPDHGWELYFARDHGVMAVHTPSRWYYFPARFDSLPLPVTRWSGYGNGTVDSTSGTSPFPVSMGSRWSYARVINGLPRWGTLDVEVIRLDSLPDGTPAHKITNSFVNSYAHVTDTSIEWYDDLADDDPECTWQLPFEVGHELADCGQTGEHISFLRVVGREDSPGTYSTYKNCWKLEVGFTYTEVRNNIGLIVTLPGYAWMADGVGLVELAVDSVVIPPYEQWASLRYVLTDYEVAP